MPIKQGFSGLWDINITVKAEAPIERLVSLNHPVNFNISSDQQTASISLKDSVDRTLVPCRDFVLLIRDTKMSEPTAVVSTTPSGHHAVSIKVLPDTRSEEVKRRIEDQIKKRIQNFKNGMIDIDATVEYKRTTVE